MGIRDFIARTLIPDYDNLIEKSQLGFNQNAFLGSSSNLSTGSGNRYSQEKVLEAYGYSPWLKTVNDVLAQRFAAIQWRVYSTSKIGKDGVTKELYRDRQAQLTSSKHRRKYMEKLQNSGELLEITSSPLLDLLNFGNPSMSGTTVRQLTQLMLELPGECLWELEMMKDKPIAILPIPPHQIESIPTTDEPHFKVRRYNGKIEEIPANEAIWFKYSDPLNPYGRGIGTGQVLGDEIEADEYAAKHIMTTFLNRARPELIVSAKDLGHDELMHAKTEFENNNRGYWNTARSYWHNGDVDIQPLNQTFEELQLLEQRTFSRDNFVQTARIPPEMMGNVENSNRATIGASLSIFAIATLEPKLEYFREKLQLSLVPFFDERLIIDYDSPIPADEEMQHNSLVNWPFAATRGELRRAAGLPHRGKIDEVYLMPAGLSVTDEFGNPLADNPEEGDDVI
jgi:HK97 family phage portal protein